MHALHSHGRRWQVIAATRESVSADPLDGRLVAIALDTKGPEIRTGALKEQLGSTVRLEKGATLTVQTADAFKEACDASTVYMDYKNLPKVMAVGQSIMVDDGLIELKVVYQFCCYCYCYCYYYCSYHNHHHHHHH